MKRRNFLLGGAAASGGLLLTACGKSASPAAAAAPGKAAAIPEPGADATPTITGHTHMLAVIGHPVEHSKSPRIHNVALARLGLDYAYLAFDIDEGELPELVAAFRTLKVRGWNLTTPDKHAILGLVDEASPVSQLVQACNTVVNDDGHLTAYTTDGIGQVQSLHDAGIEVAGRTITQMGCGGAGSAIAAQFIEDGVAELHVYNRKDAFYAPAEALAARINARGKGRVVVRDLADTAAFAASAKASSVLINTTSVGFAQQEGQSALPDTAVLRPDLFVSEIVYNPTRTLFMAQAEKAGCRTINGIGMLVHQAAASFKLWTGKDMPVDDIKRLLFA